MKSFLSSHLLSVKESHIFFRTSVHFSAIFQGKSTPKHLILMAPLPSIHSTPTHKTSGILAQLSFLVAESIFVSKEICWDWNKLSTSYWTKVNIAEKERGLGINKMRLQGQSNPRRLRTDLQFQRKLMIWAENINPAQPSKPDTYWKRWAETVSLFACDWPWALTEREWTADVGLWNWV